MHILLYFLHFTLLGLRILGSVNSSRRKEPSSPVIIHYTINAQRALNGPRSFGHSPASHAPPHPSRAASRPAPPHRAFALLVSACRDPTVPSILSRCCPPPVTPPPASHCFRHMTMSSSDELRTRLRTHSGICIRPVGLWGLLRGTSSAHPLLFRARARASSAHRHFCTSLQERSWLVALAR